MIQHMLLIMWSVPLILLGAPIIPVLRGIPRLVRRKIVGPIARSAWIRRTLNVFRRGRVAFGMFFGGIWLWHMPIMYDLALISTFVHYVEHIFFMSAAFIFWTFVIDPIPFPSRKGYVGRMLYLFGGATPTAVLGAYLTYSPQPWYTFYQKQTQLWFITVLEDQSIGGLIMWLPSWMMLLIGMGVMFFLMMRDEDQKQMGGYQ
jgi:putative membrane protein